MRITVNDSLQEFEDELSVSELIARLGIKKGPVAIALNGTVVPRDRFETTHLMDGDKVQIIHVVGGG